LIDAMAEGRGAGSAGSGSLALAPRRFFVLTCAPTV
jgi:hypothetical protein